MEQKYSINIKESFNKDLDRIKKNRKGGWNSNKSEKLNNDIYNLIYMPRMHKTISYARDIKR